MVVIAGAVLAFVVSAVTFALGHVGAGIAAASIGMLVFGGGLAWLAEERRRVRQAERDLRCRGRYQDRR
nr:LapA family protein [Mycobacterium asiaticum]